MIFYFTGTGNSRYIAEVLNSILDDELVSINECLKSQKAYHFTSGKPFVFVCPTYAWRMPHVVDDFIKNTVFYGHQKIYFILTCAGNTGKAGKYAQKLARLKDMNYMGLSEIKMPENYITMFKAPDKNEEKKLIQNAIQSAFLLAGKIKNEKAFDKVSYQIGSCLESSIINTLFYKIFVKDDGFYSTGKCISCRKCMQVCPLNNIEMEDSRPIWKHHCTQCMACIASCPKQAIEYKKKTQGKRRYYLEEHYR